ncbi:MBL fold metallo-hydrolase [Leifsonia virtsii]|uniref:MBL fold metallo-hydrolase n=1 Tax=Leifsonia virtsii TaxID=3035915 RepID=A0ABT8IWB7_9MICO|nr:MBL fold metallo-hydrolase [Leifsonia virtsii]MDN4597007.1 MBL fold metallo-hydrolase [Leifsonia virtsii]
MTSIRSTTRVAPGVLFVEGPLSNWTVFHGDGAVELVDCGYPADRPLVEESIRIAGADPAGLRRILITHGHSDHLGASAWFAAERGVVVAAALDELPNVRRDVTEQVTVRDLLPSIFARGTVRWAVAAVRAGGKADVGVRDAVALDGEEVRLNTGHTLRIVPAPGHTSGSVCFLEPESRALITGDAIVSGHPLLRETGELQQLPAFFQSDADEAARSARRLVLCDADLVLPGHGPLVAFPASARP